MRKTIIFFVLLPLVGISLLFALLLYLHNDTQLIVKMHSAKQNRLYPQIYFAKVGQPYSETQVSRPLKVKNDAYTFSLPNIDSMTRLRFDPARQEANITLTDITLVQHKWFKTIYTKIPLSTLKPAAQIDKFSQDKYTLSFSTTGNDPQIEIKLAHSKKSELFTLHPELLLVALMAYLFFVFIVWVYQKYKNETLLTAKLVLYAIFFALTLFKTVYYKEHVKFGYPPDELAHLSYVVSVENDPVFIPNYKDMVMINNKKSGNYLSHPPLYYELVGLVYDKHLSAIRNVGHLRMMSMLLFLLAFMLILYIGFRAELSILGDLVFLSLLSSVPMYAYIGASISNDTLAMLGATVFALGLKRLLDKQYTTATYLLVAIGIFLAYFSKLTAAILIFFALLFYLLYLLFTRSWITINTKQILLLTIALLPIVYYQLTITMHYHTLVPTFNVTHPAQYLESPFFVPEQYRQHLSPSEWFERMVHYIQGGWFGIHSHHSFAKASWWGYSGLLLLHIFAMIALFLPCPKTEETHSYCLLGKITMLALFAVLVIQYLFSYKAHLHSGYMGGLQPRYLLPFMFSFAIMASIFVEHFKKSFVFNVLIILVCIQAIYSDFFYFLQYYR